MTIVIVRTSTLILNFKTYNCQELGLARALTKKGYKVFIITPDKVATHSQDVVDGYAPIDIYTVTFTALNRNICWHHGVAEILANIKPDLIHINSISLTMSLWYQLWAKRHGVKSVVIQGNYEVTQKPVLKQLETLYNFTFGRYLIAHTDGIGGKTNWACDFVKRYYSKAETLLTRIGLDTERFEKAEDINWREKLGITDKKVLVYIGACEPRRNPLFLVDVLERLSSDYVLVVVGGGPQIQEMESSIKSKELGERVFLLGKLLQEKLPSLYKTADLFLLASNYEIFGMVLLESMYFGLPVVSTLTAGSDSIIESGVDGIILKDLNVKQWAECICGIVSSNKLDTMKKSAREKILEHLVWDKTANEFIALYDKAFSHDK